MMRCWGYDEWLRKAGRDNYVACRNRVTTIATLEIVCSCPCLRKNLCTYQRTAVTSASCLATYCDAAKARN
jgi:hypothetical protein